MEGRAKRKGELKAGRGVHRSCTPRASAVRQHASQITDEPREVRLLLQNGLLFTVLSVSLGFKGAHFYAAQTPQKPTASFSVQRWFSSRAGRQTVLDFERLLVSNDAM